MPKVSEYELAHVDDERFVQPTQKKRRKPLKQKKYSDKKDHRSEWKKEQVTEPSFESNEEDFELEEE